VQCRRRASRINRYRPRRPASSKPILKAVVAARRSKPGTELIWTLLSVNDDGDTPFSDDEIVSNVILLFYAGHETISIR
jgi:cytochrome P450